MKSKIGIYAITFLLVALIVAIGYFTFRFFVTNVAGTPAAYGLLLFAVVAGIATFFSPCSFPLMPGYLASFVTAKNVKQNVIFYGLAGAFGVILFSLLLGGVIGVAGEGFARSLSITTETPSLTTQILRYTIGSILILLGIFQYANLPFLLKFFHKIGHGLSVKTIERSAKGVFLYGFGYTAAGLGCAGPILSGLIIFALLSGGFLSALLAFTIYSFTMGGLMLIISILSGFAEKGIISKISEATPKIKRISAIVQILVGAFLLYSTYNLELFRQLFFP